MKTSELTGAALDWAVAKAEGLSTYVEVVEGFKPSTDWAQGGPIIEREKMDIMWNVDDVESYICSTDAYGYFGPIASCEGTTPLIAAMRCYVTSKLGDDVDVPQELTN